MNPWLAMFQSMLPKAGALRVPVKGERCISCGSYKSVSRISITKQDGMMGAIYLCEACIDAIKVMI
jgi:hypothetical protein